MSTHPMKQSRHNAIRELLADASISSQGDLRKKLIRRGFDVTQATLSRDINELRVFKGPNGYALATAPAPVDVDEPSLSEVLTSFGLSVKQALNQLVLRTTQGAAQAVAIALDHEEMNEIIGTIAGDDTVLIICPDHKSASHLRTMLEGIIG